MSLSRIRTLSSNDFNENKISTENAFNRDYFGNQGIRNKGILSDKTKNSDIETHTRIVLQANFGFNNF